MTGRDQAGLQLNWWISKKLGYVDRTLGKRWTDYQREQRWRTMRVA